MPQGTGTGTAYDENGNLLPGQHEPNPSITAVTDSAGIAGLISEAVDRTLGSVPAIISVGNDRSPLNVTTNFLSAFPGVKKVFGPSMTITGAFNDLFDYGVHHTDPGPHMIYDSGTQLGLPTQAGGCEAAGMGPC